MKNFTAPPSYRTAKRIRAGLLLGLAALWLIGSAPSVFAQTGRLAVSLSLEGALTPAMKMYLQRGVDYANRNHAELIILNLNTPGGELSLMDSLIAIIRNSPVPVVVYVAPRGAGAMSAGTIITLAGHAAAMAPETTIGAASPVDSEGKDLGETLATKIKEDYKAEVRVLAGWRGEAAVKLAEAAIDSAKAATVEEAYAAGLVDFVAADTADLLRQLNGFTVQLNGQAHTLTTTDIQVKDISISPLEMLLNILTNPNIIFLLIAIGAQAILIELSSPGGWVAGFIGVVCLALAFYGMGVLPVNWFGLVFIVTAFVLFLLDINAVSHGALTAAGVGSLIVGVLVLFNSTGIPEMQVNLPLLFSVSIGMGLSFFVIVSFALRARRLPAVLGVESLIGQTGEMRSDNSAQVAGELWTAEAQEGTLQAGEQVEVVKMKGLRVVVKKK